MTDPFARIDSSELYVLLKGDQFIREKFLSLKLSANGFKKFQRKLPEPFLTIFSFWAILV